MSNLKEQIAKQYNGINGQVNVKQFAYWLKYKIPPKVREVIMS